MFDHGLSDNLRDYALPEDGVKLIDYRNQLKQQHVDVKKISDNIYKIWNSKIEISGNKFFIEKWGKKYEFVKWTKKVFMFSGSIWQNDITNLEFTSRWLKITALGTTKIVEFVKFKKLIDNIWPNNTKLDLDWAEIEFKIV